MPEIDTICNEIYQIAPALSARALTQLATNLSILRGFCKIPPDAYSIIKVHEYAGAVLALAFYFGDDLPKGQFSNLVSFLESEAQCCDYKSDFGSIYEMLPDS